MSILGTLIDQTAGTTTAASNLTQSMSFSTHVHSLPATNPEMVHIQALSYATAGLVMGPPLLFSPGGNASVVTVGVIQGSAVSQPQVAFELTSFVFHSVFR